MGNFNHDKLKLPIPRESRVLISVVYYAYSMGRSDSYDTCGSVRVQVPDFIKLTYYDGSYTLIR